MEIWIELLTAIGRFFINPLLYVALIVAIGLGYFRVKRERRYFMTRIVWGWTELRSFWKEALIISLVISVIYVAAGLTVTPTFIIFISAMSIVALFTFRLSILSAGYLGAITVAVIWWLDKEQWRYSFWLLTIEGTDIFEGLVTTVSIIVGLLLIAEGVLIRKTALTFSSPIVEKTQRGLRGIVFKTKRIWLLPLLFVIPGDLISQYAPYWPQFTLGAESFSIGLFPFILGFSKSARRTLPMYLFPKIGRAVIALGYAVTVVGVGSYFEQFVGVLALVLACLGRLMISLVFALKERSDVYAVAPRSTGAVIVAVMPNSPAEKMGLKVGETIKKVNGIAVFNTRELYEALQQNAAHCKLEVLDHQNEIRLTQHVVYSHDHHRIGLLIAEKEDLLTS